MRSIVALPAVLFALAAVLSQGAAMPMTPPPSPGAPRSPAAPAEDPAYVLGFTVKDMRRSPPPEPKDPAYVLGFTVKDIDGKDVDLATYKGKVVVIVNVASKCGFTPQYEGLEALYREKKEAGLVILGFPANNFGKQEPGTNADIKKFCEATYKVTFPLFEKISVKGEDQHPLYRKLASQPDPIGGDPKWNFTKFVVDRTGKVVARYDAARAVIGTAKLEPELLKKVGELLDEKRK